MSAEISSGPLPESAGASTQARAGVAMAIATLSMAAASGIQALLYLSTFGVNGRTDGLFVAFALYAIVGVFSQCIRITSVPLLVEPNARLGAGQFAAALVVVAAPIAIATTVLAHPLAVLLAPGLSAADRAVTEDALPILGGAMVLQLWAAGAAAVLAMRDRFRQIAFAYVAGAVGGLLTYLAVQGTADELSLGWSMLGMAIVTTSLMLAGARGAVAGHDLGRVRPAAAVTDAGLLLGRTMIYLAVNMLILVTLSWASRFSPGDATILSYAYLYASYLVAGTSLAVGMSRIPEMSRGAREDWSAVLAETVPHGYRYAILLVAPALAALVAAGAPLVGALFPTSLPSSDVTTLQTFGALLVPWTVAALLVNFLLPAMFAVGRARFVNLLAVPLVAVHVAITAAASALFGVNGAVGALFIAPLSFAAVLLVAEAGPRRGPVARALAWDTALFVGLAAVAFGIGAALGAVPASALAGAVIAGLVGSVIYAVAARFAAARQVEVLLGAVRPSSG